MRRSIAKKGTDICFFCALRLEATSVSHPSFRLSPRQTRTYKSSSPSWRPAGAATAQRQDDDDNAYLSQRAPPAGQPAPLVWKCICGHLNNPRRGECTICSITKPSDAQRTPKDPPTSRSSRGAPSAAQPTRTPVRDSLASTANTPSPSPSIASRLTGATLARVPPALQRTASQPDQSVQRPPGFQLPTKQRPSQETPFVYRKLDLDTAAHEPSPFPIRRFQTKGPGGQYHEYPPVQSENAPPGREPDRDRGRFGAAQNTPAQIYPRSSSMSTFLRDRPAYPAPASSRPSPSLPSSLRGQEALDQLTQASEQSRKPSNSRPPFRKFRSEPLYRMEPKEAGQQLASFGDKGSRSFPRGERDSPPEAIDRPAWKLPPVKSPSRPSTESAVELAPLVTSTEDVEDVEVGTEFGRRRRGDKLSERQMDRRRERFELDETVSNSPDKATGEKRGKTGYSGPKDPRLAAFELEMAEAERQLMEDDETGNRNKRRKEKKLAERARPKLELPEFIGVEALARLLRLKPDKFIDQLKEEGFEGPRYDHVLDAQTSAMFAELNGFEPIILENDTREDIVARPPPEDPSILPQRPPIVTIMGHVDHGKTTILDWLRKSSVVESEHGGITQHIGAFSVTMPGTQRTITFLDTPGHAAFLDMRRRGANVTDIVVLVVAADDSVKPQTLEAIKHAKDAGVQMIIAINKVDKEDANIEKVKQDLAREDVTVEDYGGEYQAIPLSGKTGQGMANLEEAIITLADVSDFRAEADGPVEGAIIESKVTAAGRVATILVRRGTLHIGDFIVAGNTWARVRTLRNDAGVLVEEAPPGTPVQVDGWRGEDPTAGLEVLEAEDEQHAKDVVELRAEKTESMKTATEMATLNATKSAEAEARAKVREWELEQGWGLGRQRRGRHFDNEGWVEPSESSGPKRIHFVVKADVAGSTEAIVAAVSIIGNSDVMANIVHSGTGHLSESDIRLLAATGETSYAINFNQPIDGTIHRLAEAANVHILDNNIIYKVTDQVKEKLSDELPPLITHKVLGEAELGQIFEITTKKAKVKIAGCRVTNGTISRSQKVKVLRDNEVIFTGNLDSLKNVKKDVSEMRKGSECGMGFRGWDEFLEGDKIQCFEELKERRKLY